MYVINFRNSQVAKAQGFLITNSDAAISHVLKMVSKWKITFHCNAKSDESQNNNIMFNIKTIFFIFYQRT